MKGKFRKALAAFAAIALLLPVFAAFEAHVINVKAHVENALEVSPKRLDYGVVFPQETLEQQFVVSLSKSFLEQDRVNDVYYKLAQKRKLREIPKLDVVFAFDLTGSMGGALAEAKARSKDIMDLLSAVSPDVQFGVMSHVDYPYFYDSYGYANWYGVSPDYAYKLDQSLTADKTVVKGVIDGLATYSGADGPQNYTRIMYESYADPLVGWRAGTEQAVIMLNDNLPHDNDVNEGVPGKVGTLSFGGDPGRDEVMFTADDLDLQTELAAMAANGKKLYALRFAGGPLDLDYWKHWTGLTGGDAVVAGDYADIVEAIKALFLYADLRPFLVKEKKPELDLDTEDAADLGNWWPDGAGGTTRDVLDDWRVVLKVPCIEGAVGQDYTGPVAPKEDDYGADIWVEVTGFSYPPEPPPGP